MSSPHLLLLLLLLMLCGCASTAGLAGGGEERDRAPSRGDVLSSAEAPGAPNGGGAATSGCAETGASVFGGHCYFLIAEGSQSASRDRCTAQNAHLVTITSAAEQAHVAEMSTASTWVGLQATTGTNDPAAFAWITGEARAVDFWHPGQPNSGRGCVVSHYSDRLWRDVQCTNTYPAVCERD